ncbi:MAG: NAD(P) transhydrogenase subunit alpha [Bryobacteraceae bacterium]|nr:NAD(P) transhydrogenase subunit alpha [Bryobacterales bacterium]MEB2362240.1 NAD(P) transhydrogenase subunit alpha [Bryobacterales bacterium]NUM99646.1 NAD(P) transhydrogenase subunit alpha [Bryobacteraceae bacterium]
MIIGIPREILENEHRVAALPESVAEYRKMGFGVLVETAAGAGVHRSDSEYAAAGAEIAASASDVFSRSDIILKVKQPSVNQEAAKHEVLMMREGGMLIAFLHPAAPPNHEMVRMLRDRNITSLTMDGIPRISRAQQMDALTSMSTVTGYRSVLLAATHLPKFVPMIGTAIGTVKPARFLVIGAGVVGLQAIATAKRLGATVEALDIQEPARKAAQSLGAKIAGFEVPPELAADGSGAARALPAEWLDREREAIAAALERADAVIASALVPGEMAPVLITPAMVSRMKPGSVIIDVSIDQGGNCALSEAGHEVVRESVFLCGLLNIPGSMPVDASWLYANNVLHYVQNLFKKGIETPDFEDDIVQHTLVTRQGRIVHAGALKAMEVSDPSPAGAAR